MALQDKSLIILPSADGKYYSRYPNGNAPGGGGGGLSPNIVWYDGYDQGDYTNWISSDGNTPQFSGIPAYGRPVAPSPLTGTRDASYYGDGSLMSLVASPTRGGTFSNKVTVKNSINGSEPADCDNGVCTRRRSELQLHLYLFPTLGAMAYLDEWWFSISYYIPSDWSDSGSGFGPTLFQLKSPNTNNISPPFSIICSEGAWRIFHRWSHADNPNDFGVLPWQYQMFYGWEQGTGIQSPSATNWPDGLAHYPNQAASVAALASVNKGGWTDWVAHVRADGRGAGEGGTGYLDLWKREDSGAWVQVLHITPGETTRGGLTFDHGILYKVPGSGFGPLAGMYMGKDQVWSLPQNRVLYNANIKVGNSFATFADMSHDGSTP